MKKIILFIGLGLMINSLMAQYSTPGTGKTYTLTDLVSLSGGVVTAGYHINANLTIAYPDTLLIEEDGEVLMAADVLIDVKGSMVCAPPNMIKFSTASPDIFFEGIDIDDAAQEDNEAGSSFKKVYVERSGGISLKNSKGMMIESCTFANNTHTNVSGAIACYHSSPVIAHCTFIDNDYPAISSGATAAASPKILYCLIQNNGTANSNRPQINLGAGAEGELIFIHGNHIVGGPHDKVGGVSIATMAGGNIEAIITNNIIKDNRYGINVFGNNVEAQIKNNSIVDNNTETNPMNGGSGITCYGNESNHALITHNKINGNLWGVTVVNSAMPYLSTPDEGGFNHIQNNGNNGTVYELYNNTANNLMAQQNYWGGDEAVAEAGIVHQTDNAELGLVNYIPVLSEVPSAEALLSSCTLLVNGLEISGYISEDEKTVVFSVPQGTDLNNVILRFSISDGAKAFFEGDELISEVSNLSLDASVSMLSKSMLDILPECGVGNNYELLIEYYDGLNEWQGQKITLYPNPTQGLLNISAEADITLYDVRGQKLLSQTACQQIDISQLPTGVYIAKIYYQGQCFVHKLVKK